MGQDLRCYVLEKMGHDVYHPSYGSLIDGGQNTNGQMIPSPIGQANNSIQQMLIESEIQRICSTYQASQLARQQQDLSNFGKSTLSPDEILQSVSSISITSNLDSVSVTVYIITAANNQQIISLTLT